MLSVFQRSARVFVTAAVLSSLAGTSTAAAGLNDQATGAVRTDRLDHAASLLSQGLVVEAKSELVVLNRSAASQAEKARIFELLAQADKKLSALDEVEISLQKSALAVKQGDLRLADSHANAAKRNDRATPDQRLRASKLLDESALLRDELAPMIGPALDQAVTDFENKNYSEAKAGLASIARSGVTLSNRQSQTLVKYQQQIVEMERSAGKPFEVDYVPLGVLRAAAGEMPEAVATLPAEPIVVSEPAPAPAPAAEPVATMAMISSSEPIVTADAEIPVIQSEPVEEIESTPAMMAPATTPEDSGTTTHTEVVASSEPIAYASSSQDDPSMLPPRGTQPEPTPAPAPAPAPTPVAEPAPAAPADTSGADAMLNDSAKWDAERTLREADDAFDSGRLNEAIQKYTDVTTRYSQNLPADAVSRAQTRLREARARMGVEGGGILPATIEQREIQRQQVEAEVTSLLSQADGAVSAGNTTGANDAVAEARLRWKDAFNQGVLSEAQYNQRLAEIDAMGARIKGEEEAIREREAAERGRRLEGEKVAAAERAQSELQARITESLDRLSALQREQKYEEALQVIDEVLFLDPTNPSALLMKEIIEDVIHYQEWEKTLRERNLGYAAESLETLKATVPPERLVEYPSDWPDISFRRGEVVAYQEPLENRKVLATLEKTKVPASFSDNALEDVLAFVGTVTNLQMDIDWDSLTAIGIEKDARVSLELREVPAKVVLERVLSKVSPDEFSKAAWAVKDGVLVVASAERLKKDTIVRIYDIRDLLFQVPNFENVPELDVDSVLQQGQGGGRGGGTSNIFQDDEEDEEDEQDVEAQQRDRLIEIIQTNVDFEGWRDNGGDTGIVQELNGNLIITNTPANHREIVGLLTQLREVRNLQINVEARFLIVSQDFFEKIGLDLDIYFNARNNQFRAAQAQQEAFGLGTLTGEGLTVLPSDLVGSGARADGATTPPGYYVQAVDPDTGEVTYVFESNPQSVVTPEPLSIIPVQSGSDQLAESLLEGSEFAAQILGLNPAIGIAGTFLDDVQVDFLVEATQADRRSVVLTAPRLTFTNGRTANIYVANQQGFISDLTPVVGTGSVAFDPTLSTANEGFTLLVRGVVSADRRYVTLAIEASIAELQGFDERTFTAAAGGTGDGGGGAVTAPSPIQLPISQVTRVQTGVTIPDQGTILLGGQRISTEIEVETGVPVLSKIPIINRFFTNRSMVKEEQTLLILMKPTILIQNEEEEMAFPGLLDKLKDPFQQ